MLTNSVKYVIAAFLLAHFAGAITPPLPPKKNKTETTPQAAGEVEKRMASIVFPKISFEDASIAAVAKYLTVRSKDLDSEKKGVRVQLDPGKRTQKKLGDRPVTMDFDNIPMSKLLEYLCKGAGMEMRVENDGVYLAVPKKKRDGQ